MEEPIKTEEQIQEQPKQEPEQVVNAISGEQPQRGVTIQPEEDIFKRVSSFKPEEHKEETPFNVNDIEKIEDPKAKEYAQSAYKSFERGYQKKYQEIAQMRKEYEQKLAEANQPWTTERIQSLLNDPNFVKAAQSVAGTNTEEEDPELRKIKQQQQVLAQQLYTERMRREDEKLLNKYADYDPNAVDIITAELLTNKRIATREDIWKVMKYDEHVRRAYEMGRVDERDTRKKDLVDKQAASSIDGSHLQATERIEPEAGEHPSKFLIRAYVGHMKKQAARK